ncbi:MAG: hypothetical protein GEU99_12690 [Luteitalea sp.]|nr:hypothetical protein [Luteitalea sp.]
MDLGIVYARSGLRDARGLHYEPLYEEEFVIVVPDDHPLAKRRRIPIRGLCRFPLIAFSDDSHVRTQVLDPTQAPHDYESSVRLIRDRAPFLSASDKERILRKTAKRSSSKWSRPSLARSATLSIPAHASRSQLSQKYFSSIGALSSAIGSRRINRSSKWPIFHRTSCDENRPPRTTPPPSEA